MRTAAIAAIKQQEPCRRPSDGHAQ
jgi:hypothetical protein